MAFVLFVLVNENLSERIIEFIYPVWFALLGSHKYGLDGKLNNIRSFHSNSAVLEIVEVKY